jgi:hypothetical protein
MGRFFVIPRSTTNSGIIVNTNDRIIAITDR